MADVEEGSILVAEEANAAAKAERQSYRQPVRIAPDTWTDDDFEEMISSKTVIFAWGEPDAGKSFQMFRFALGPDRTGRVLVLQFDNHSKQIKVGDFADTKQIRVLDVGRLYSDVTPETQGWSAKVAIDYMLEGLQRIGPKFHPHFVVIDGMDRYAEISQQYMRWLHNVAPSQGFKQRSWWKDNVTALLTPIRKGLQVSAMGVIVCGYVKEQFADENSPVYTEKERKPNSATRVAYNESSIGIEFRTSYDSTLKSKSYEAYVQKAKPDCKDLVILGDTYDLSPEKPGQHKRFPWGPGWAKRFAAADEAMKDLEITGWPKPTARSADLPVILPPPQFAPQVPDVPEFQEPPKKAVRSPPPPVTARGLKEASDRALKAAGIDPTSPPTAELGQDEV